MINCVLGSGAGKTCFQVRLEEARYTHLIVEAHRKAVDIVLILLRVGLSPLVCSNLWKLGRMSAALPRATTVIGTSLWRFRYYDVLYMDFPINSCPG